MKTLLSLFDVGTWAWIGGLAIAALAIVWRMLAGAKKAGKAEQKAEQAQADAKARREADEIQNDVGAMPADARREALKKWAPK